MRAILYDTRRDYRTNGCRGHDAPGQVPGTRSSSLGIPFVQNPVTSAARRPRLLHHGTGSQGQPGLHTSQHPFPNGPQVVRTKALEVAALIPSCTLEQGPHIVAQVHFLKYRLHGIVLHGRAIGVPRTWPRRHGGSRSPEPKGEH